MSNSERWITTTEASKLMGFHIRTIYRYIKKGYIEAKQLTVNKPWRINYLSIPPFLRKHELDLKKHKK